MLYIIPIFHTFDTSDISCTPILMCRISSSSWCSYLRNVRYVCTSASPHLMYLIYTSSSLHRLHHHTFVITLLHHQHFMMFLSTLLLFIVYITIRSSSLILSSFVHTSHYYTHTFVRHHSYHLDALFVLSSLRSSSLLSSRCSFRSSYPLFDHSFTISLVDYQSKI